MQPLSQNRIDKSILALFLFLATVSAIYAGIYYNVDMDDFYITMRYAVNLAEGGGWVFNEGERVLGTTTPLLTLLIAAFVKTGINAVISVRIICSLALLGTAIFTFLYFRDKKQLPLGFVAGLLFFFTLPVKQLWGNEIPLCFLFIMGSLYFYHREKWTASAVFQCLYALTRMEGVLFFCILTGILFWKKRKILIGVLIPPLAILVPWFLFSRFYFGDFFPNTLYAKARQGGETALWDPFSHFFFRTLKLLFLNKEWPFLSLCAWCGLYPLFRKRHLLLLGWCAIHQAAYWIIGVPGSYEWYFYPLWLLFPLTMGGGIYLLGLGLKDFREAGKMRILSYSLLGIFLFFQAVRQPYLNTFYNKRKKTYEKAADFITENYPAGTDIIADEIGIIGYLLMDYPILDTAGLVHRDLPQDAYYNYKYLVQTQKPLLIINNMTGDPEKKEVLEPLLISSGDDRYEYRFVRAFPGYRFLVRILERKEKGDL